MMKLSSIQVVGSTVGPDGSCPIAEQILERWGYDKGSIQSVRFSSNFVFTFRQQGVKRFLRFAPATEKQVGEIQSEIQLLTWLAEKGFQVSEPIASKSGNYIETINTSLGVFHAVVFQALQGKQLQLEELDESQYKKWGEALGRLHSAFHVYSQNRLKRPSFTEHLNVVRDHILDDVPWLYKELKVISNWVESLPITIENFGLIHFDFELDNLYWNHDGVIQMLDFDDCTYHWYVADLAFALQDLVDEEVPSNQERFRDVVSGYSSHFAVDEELLRELPMFLKLRKLYRYAQLKRSVDLSVKETSDWLKPLHQKLSTAMEMYQLSLMNSKKIRFKRMAGHEINRQRNLS